MSLRLFISYSHADGELVGRLHKHLAQLQRDGTIAEWYDQEIHAGDKIDDEISAALDNADVFLACASPDYIASFYCFERELQLALSKEKRSEIRVIPVVFEPCDWLNTPLSTFKAVPEDGKPVSEFTNPNVALLQVATELRRLAREPGSSPPEEIAATPSLPATAAPSRYRAKKEFDQLDKRDFAERSYGEIYRFFEASISELQALPEIEARLSPFTDDSFSCTVINRGVRRGFETIHVRRGGSWGEIDYLFGERNTRNTSSGAFQVEADDYQLHLRGSGFSMSGESRIHLSSSEAAQVMWDELLSKVGIDYG
jgi:hypothetical protein